MKIILYFFNLVLICFTLGASNLIPSCLADDLDREVLELARQDISKSSSETRKFAIRIYNLKDSEEAKKLQEEILRRHTTEFMEGFKQNQQPQSQQIEEKQEEVDSPKTGTDYHLLHVYLEERIKLLNQRKRQMDQGLFLIDRQDVSDSISDCGAHDRTRPFSNLPLFMRALLVDVTLIRDLYLGLTGYFDSDKP